MLVVACYLLMRGEALFAPYTTEESKRRLPPAGTPAESDAPAQPPAELSRGKWTGRIGHVIDGDSFYLWTADKREVEVRMVGINAPEMDTAAGTPAREYAQQLLQQATRIEVEPEPSGPLDKHGRILCWVWLDVDTGSGSRRLLLNEEMVRGARVPLFKYASPKMKYYQRLVEAGGGPVINY